MAWLKAHSALLNPCMHQQSVAKKGKKKSDHKKLERQCESHNAVICRLGWKNINAQFCLLSHYLYVIIKNIIAQLRCCWQEIPCEKSASSITQFSSLVIDHGQIKLFMSGKEFGGNSLFQRAWNIEKAGQGNSPSQQNLLVQDSDLHQSGTRHSSDSFCT